MRACCSCSSTSTPAARWRKSSTAYVPVRAGPSTSACCFGYRLEPDSLAEKRYPSRTEIDSALSDVPVLVYRIDGHSAVTNSAGLHLRANGPFGSPAWTKTARATRAACCVARRTNGRAAVQASAPTRAHPGEPSARRRPRRPAAASPRWPDSWALRTRPTMSGA